MADNTAGQIRTTSDKQDSPAVARGKIVLDATALTATDSLRVACGFTPRYVRIVNVTDRIEAEWFDGMDANSCLKTVAAGTRTLEVTGGNGGITVDRQGFRILQNATLAVIAASKTIVYEAQG
ncbi:hypothetical protein [Ottowia sp. VDI28]|uniref:hypothetical protein n=1 Tax=Ottowia sp. VDI28 TaxID=3133968 RepID=UPI003C30381F